MTSVPPSSEVASPSDDTVTSMRSPGPIEGVRSAVTITAATLRVRSVVGRGGLVVLVVSFLTLMPIFSSIDCRDCSVNGALRSVSPVPFRPMTRP